MSKYSIKVCLIYNYAPHYRLGICKLMDQNLQCDFYFGDKMDDLKKINYNELVHFKKELKNLLIFKNIYWQKGAFSLLFKKYNRFIITGEYFCLSTWVILLLAKFSRKKVYLWTHGWYGNESRIKRIVKKIFFNLSNGIFLYGNYAKRLMIDEGFKDSKLHVIYNSLDYDKQIFVRNKIEKSNIFENHFKNNNPVLIFIGRLTKIKKLDLLLDAQKVLLSNNQKINIVFLGKGEEKTILHEKAKQLGVSEHVWFYGEIYNEEEIGNLIYNATICVSPGNVGLTAMHSLVYGTPVITHSDFKNQMPEFESIKEGVSGAFFEKGNLDSLVEKIQNWISEKTDREKVRLSCFEIIDKYYNPQFQLREICRNIDLYKK